MCKSSTECTAHWGEWLCCQSNLLWKPEANCCLRLLDRSLVTLKGIWPLLFYCALFSQQWNLGTMSKLVGAEGQIWGIRPTEQIWIIALLLRVGPMFVYVLPKISFISRTTPFAIHGRLFRWCPALRILQKSRVQKSNRLLYWTRLFGHMNPCSVKPQAVLSWIQCNVDWNLSLWGEPLLCVFSKLFGLGKYIS